MFCLFEVPRNFSDSTNPGLYMDSLLKHKKLKRDGGGGEDKKNLKHASCSTQPICRMPTENLLLAKRKSAYKQCTH